MANETATQTEAAGGSPPPIEDFEQLLNESLGESAGFEGSVVKGTVLGVENDVVLIDVGLKSEGRVPLREFFSSGVKLELNPGDTVEVFVERYENRDGLVVLSRERARREEAWTQLEAAFQDIYGCSIKELDEQWQLYCKKER